MSKVKSNAKPQFIQMLHSGGFFGGFLFFVKKIRTFFHEMCLNNY